MSADWHVHYEEGKAAFEKGNQAEALRHFKFLLEEGDTFADIYNMLGIIYQNMGRRGDAIEAFEKALDINPRYTEACLNLSVVYNEAGEIEKAQQVYALAKQARSDEDLGTYLDPFVKGKLANMHAQIGHIYKDLGLYPEASQEYTAALALRPDLADIKAHLGMVYREMKDFSRSIKQLEGAAEINPKYTLALTQLGLTYYIMGEKDKAKVEWVKVLEYSPDNKLALMYINMLDKDEDLQEEK